VSVRELGAHILRVICSNCHGNPQAVMPSGAPAPASLKDIRQRLTPADVLALLETGRRQMPSFSSLSATERQAVIAFLFDDRSGGTVKLSNSELERANRI